MRVYVYNSGIAALSAQDGQAFMLAFSGFKISNTAAFDFNAADNNLPGDIVYTAGAEALRYVPITANDVMVQCFVERDVAEMTMGSIQLLVNTNSQQDIPFCVSIADESFVKIATVPGVTVGTKYTYQLMLSIPQLLERFTFVNLKAHVATFRVFDNENSMEKYPWEEQHDQLVIDRHSKLDAMVFGLNAWGDYWGNPLLAPLDSDNMWWKISGGRVGDGHRFVDAS